MVPKVHPVCCLMKRLLVYRQRPNVSVSDQHGLCSLCQKSFSAILFFSSLLAFWWCFILNYSIKLTRNLWVWLWLFTADLSDRSVPRSQTSPPQHVCVFQSRRGSRCGRVRPWRSVSNPPPLTSLGCQQTRGRLLWLRECCLNTAVLCTLNM